MGSGLALPPWTSPTTQVASGCLGFAMLALFALMASLLIPRRRVWVRQHEDGTIELAALARGDDARLDDFLLGSQDTYRE
jgi:cytochrome c biogenesis protein ResB